MHVASILRRSFLCALVGCMLLAGCGGSSITTGTIDDATTVQPDQYLADSRMTADAINEFVAVVNEFPSPLTQAALRQSAPTLSVSLLRAQQAQSRLVAMRLEDRRLEAQRSEVVNANAEVVSAMDLMRNAAAAGNAAAAKAAAADLQTAIAALRAVGQDS